MMRGLATLLLLVCLAVGALAQGYRPKPGETVMKMEIEGRGDVFIRLHTREAPRTTAHVMGLVRNRFYDGQRFHRVERTPRPYLIQIGDPASKQGPIESAGNGGSGARIPFEDSGQTHGAGAVGLARIVEDQNSGDSQFYILLSPARFLDGRYTVFGQVVAGMEVVAKVERGDRVVSVTLLVG